jgi:type I restriction enzyme S subunit
VSEWREVALGEIGAPSKHSLATGPFGSAIASKFFEASGVPVIRGSNLSRDVGKRLIPSGFAYVSEEKAEKHARSLAMTGDLIFTCWGTIGQVGYLDGTSGHRRFLLSNKQMKMTPNPEVADGLFLYYALSSPAMVQQFQDRAIGSAVPGFNLGQLRELRAAVPRLSTQRRIAAVLSAFDDLIEINERRIELLEDVARALYREWFVHFRLPGQENVELVDSELGPIPEGWEVRTVEELAAVVRGRSYRRVELSESEGVPFLNLKCMKRGGGFRRYGLKRYVGRYKDEQRVVPGDVLVAVTDMTQERRIVAQAMRMPDLGEPFAVPSLDLALVRPTHDGIRPFLYAALRYSGFSESVRHYANGANVLHLAVDRILEYSLAVPDTDLLRRFTTAVSPILDKSEFLEVQNRQLAAARDLLLPRLVTGRLDISDIDLGVLTPLEAE